MVKNKYSFQLSDNFAPKQVIENELKKISEETHGYVQGEISDYRGPIRSYKKSSRGSFTTLLTKPSNTSNTVDVDIQEDLGELSFDRYRYEVYLRVKGLDKYKYRIMFVEYNEIAYPTTIVLDKDSISEYHDKYSDTLKINSMQELQTLLDRILNSDTMHSLIQSLINEAIRRENSSAHEVETTPKN